MFKFSWELDEFTEQKSAYFEYVSCDSYIATLLTIDNYADLSMP